MMLERKIVNIDYNIQCRNKSIKSMLTRDRERMTLSSAKLNIINITLKISIFITSILLKMNVNFTDTT